MHTKWLNFSWSARGGGQFALVFDIIMLVVYWPFYSILFYQIDLGPVLQLCPKIFEIPVVPAFIFTHMIGFDSFKVVLSTCHVSFDICNPSKRAQTLYIEALLFKKLFDLTRICCSYNR